MPNVKVSGGKRPYYYIRYRVRVLVARDQFERKEKQHFLGYCDEISKRQAERMRDTVMVEINGQVYTLQSQIRFADFVELYRRDHLVTLAPGGKKRDESLLKNHIIPELGSRGLCEIGALEVQQFLNQKEADGLSRWTPNRMKAMLSSLFAKAQDWGYWQGKNPVTKARLGRKKPKRQKQILTDSHFQMLLKELPPIEALMVKTAASTSMRVSEVLGLKWDRVNLERGLVRVDRRLYRGDFDEPKTEGSKRIVPLGMLCAEFRQLRPADAQDDDFVFQRDGKPLDDRAILRNCIRPAAKRLGIYFEGFGWHTFRRQNLTLMQEEGATAFEAQAQAGHTKPSMTWEYTVVGLDRREQSVLRVQQRLFGRAESSEAA